MWLAEGPLQTGLSSQGGPCSRLHGRRRAHRAVCSSLLRPPAGGQTADHPHRCTRRGVSPPPGGRWPKSRHEGSRCDPSASGGPWPLDVMKQHPPPDTAGTAHSRPPPALLPSPQPNRNTWDGLPRPAGFPVPRGAHGVLSWQEGHCAFVAVMGEEGLQP